MPAPGAMTCILSVDWINESGRQAIFFEGPRQSSREEFGDLGEVVSPLLYYNGGVVVMKPMHVKPLLCTRHGGKNHTNVIA